MEGVAVEEQHVAGQQRHGARGVDQRAVLWLLLAQEQLGVEPVSGQVGSRPRGTPTQANGDKKDGSEKDAEVQEEVRFVSQCGGSTGSSPAGGGAAMPVLKVSCFSLKENRYTKRFSLTVCYEKKANL